MSKKWVVIDFETASGIDLKKCGAYVYAEHPTTEITALAWSDNAGNSGTIDPTGLGPEGVLLERVLDPATIFVAHNVQFERAIWRCLMVPMGWPDIPIERWHDTMAVALSKGLPAKLDVLARAIKLDTHKDMVGSSLAISLSKPNKKTGMLDRTPETMRKVLDYCAQDVKVEVEALKFLGNFQGGERKVWELDQRINDRGIRIDDKYVKAAQSIVNQSVPQLIREFREITGINPTQGEKFKTWLANQGVAVASLNKEAVSRLLGGDEDGQDNGQDGRVGVELPGPCRRALKIRGLAAGAAVKKLPAMLACQGVDGRARGLLQYHGAGPGRWAGRILQPHNFPRAGVDVGDNQTAKPDELVAAIIGGDVDFLRMVYGEPLEAVAAGLRHALVADDNKTFLIGDFAQIEARIVLAVAGQYDAVQTFVDGDPYCAMAEKIFHQPVTKKEHPEKRQIGKNTILGCFAGDTSVLTNRGFIPILHVGTGDLLWDGVEWVKHEGLVDQGKQVTISVLGVSATPDHQILCGTQWRRLDSLEHDVRGQSRALARGSANLPSSDMSGAFVGACPSWLHNAHVEPRRIGLPRQILLKARLPDVTNVPRNRRASGRKNIGGMRTFFRMMCSVLDFLIASVRVLTGATTKKHGTSTIMVGGVSLFLTRGTKIAGRFFRIFSRYLGGTTRTMILTVPTTIRDTCPETCALLPGGRTMPIDGLLPNYRPVSRDLKPVYDLVNAGPRNRFTILTNSGPVIVHNCGFGMGHVTFRSRYAHKEPAEFAKGCIDAYRKDFAPKVPELWYGLERASTRAVWEGGAHDYNGIVYQMEGPWLTCRLPSGRKLWYFEPRQERRAMPWDEKDIRPSWSHMTFKAGVWMRRDAYGGLLTENVVQAMARDLLVSNMFLCEREGLPIVLTVHDEVVVESVPSRMSEFEDIMKSRPQWAVDYRIPVAVETMVSTRYRK